MKREIKKMRKHQRSAITGEPIAVRGDPGYQSSESESESSHSSQSYGGVPEADLEYLSDNKKRIEINTRRNVRRAQKWQIIFDEVVSVDIKREISEAILTHKAQYNLSTQSQDMESEPASPGSKAVLFAESQRKMKAVMDKMAEQLKSRFLEDIDEEQPEEYLALKEQETEESMRKTMTSQEVTQT